jgi:hypothetical protein
MRITIDEPMILVQDVDYTWYLIRESDKELFNKWDIETNNGGVDFSNLAVNIEDLKIYSVEADID